MIFWPHSPFSTQAQVLDRPHPACRWHTPRARPAAQAQTPALTGELTPTGLTALALTLVLALLPALAMGLVLAPALAAVLARAFVNYGSPVSCLVLNTRPVPEIQYTTGLQ